MLVDSNIIIYASQAQHPQLRQFIAQHAPAVSVVSYVEVLGYHKLSDAERQHFEIFFQASLLLPLNGACIEQAVKLRQARKMTLGDALIAATALVHGRILITRNAKDFTWVPDLQLLNPLDGNS